MECLIRGGRCGAEASLGSFNTGFEDDVVAERSFTSTRAWMAFSPQMISHTASSTDTRAALSPSSRVFECKCPPLPLSVKAAAARPPQRSQRTTSGSAADGGAPRPCGACVFPRSGGEIRRLPRLQRRLNPQTLFPVSQHRGQYRRRFHFSCF